MEHITKQRSRLSNLRKNIDAAAPCAGPTVVPDWSGFTTAPLLFTCPDIGVSIGSYSPLPGIKFSVYGNSYISGRVGIGSDPTINNASSYKLIVGGKIAAREVVVSSLTPWPDYVFSKEYPLTSLNDVSDFISTNHHLPGIPPADEIKENGQSLGELQILQQMKIEELYLYIIQLENRINTLEKKGRK